MPSERDYSLNGKDGAMAVQNGMASARWYHSPLPQADMKRLLCKSDSPAIRDTCIWLGGMVVCASGVILCWPGWWSLPFLCVYGVLYGSASDSRWHECGHGTAFKTKWMNDVVYQIACFMIMRNPVTWRSSHRRHHANTIIVGRDPEIQAQRPPNLWIIALNCLGIPDVIHAVRIMCLNAIGKLDAEEAAHIPVVKHSQVFRIARIWLILYFAVIMLAWSLNSVLPLLLVGTPRMYGAWHHVLTGLLQHAALADNVLDHRLNTRTVYMNPVSRFVYWNMNYHVEHHMYPMVPYHALPELHKLLKPDLPIASRSINAALAEILPVLYRQRKDPEFYLLRSLPDTARPYRYTVQ